MRKEVKTSIDGLKIGMFVSRLDQPWLKTKFALEGIKISSKEDIESVRKYCSYVYVDVEKGISPDTRYWILGDKPKRQVFGEMQQTEAAANAARKEFQSLRQTTYQSTSKLDVEIKSAKQATGKLSKDYDQLLLDVEQGRDIDLSVVKSGLSDMVESVIRNPSAMMWIIKLKGADKYSYSRALGTSVWCATFGRHLGLEKISINQLALGGLLLDVGKSRLPSRLLQKEGKFSSDDLIEMKSHVDLGLKILVAEGGKQKVEKLDHEVLQMVATHHERFNGSGYPQGLKDQSIPMFGRIAGIADSYDAMVSVKPYMNAEAKTPHEAISILYELRAAEFQAELVEQFIQTIGLYPTGSLVELNTGEVGAVMAINGLRRLRPTLMLLLDEKKEPYDVFKYLDLSKSDSAIEVSRGLPSGAYGINMQELFL